MSESASGLAEDRNMIRLRHTIVFTGKVQGVGFRVTARQIALRYAVSGWVGNEPDRSVTCVVEGKREELERFHRAVMDALHGYARDSSVVESPATGEFDGFEIHRSGGPN